MIEIADPRCCNCCEEIVRGTRVIVSGPDMGKDTEQKDYCYHCLDAARIKSDSAVSLGFDVEVRNIRRYKNEKG